MKIEITDNMTTSVNGPVDAIEQVIENVEEVKDTMSDEIATTEQVEVPAPEVQTENSENNADTTTEPVCTKPEPEPTCKKVRTHVILMPNQLLPKKADIDVLNTKAGVYVIAHSMQEFYGVKSSRYISDEIIQEINKTVEPDAVANCINEAVRFASRSYRNADRAYILLGVTPNNLATLYQVNVDMVTSIIPAVSLADTIISYIDRVIKNIKRYNRLMKKNRARPINFESMYLNPVDSVSAHCERSIKDISARMEEFSGHITDCPSNMVSVVVCTHARILNLIQNIINQDML